MYARTFLPAASSTDAVLEAEAPGEPHHVIGIVSRSGGEDFLSRLSRKQLTKSAEAASLAPGSPSVDVYVDSEARRIYLLAKGPGDFGSLSAGSASLPEKEPEVLHHWIEERESEHATHLSILFGVCQVVLLLAPRMRLDESLVTQLEAARLLKNELYPEALAGADAAPRSGGGDKRGSKKGSTLEPPRCLPTIGVPLQGCKLSDLPLRDRVLKSVEERFREMVTTGPNLAIGGPKTLEKKGKFWRDSRQDNSKRPLFTIDPKMSILPVSSNGDSSSPLLRLGSLFAMGEAELAKEVNTGFTAVETFLARHDVNEEVRQRMPSKTGKVKDLPPSLLQWWDSARNLRGIYETDKAKLIAKKLIPSNPDLEFSEDACQRAYGEALEHYLKGLPARYPSDVHIERKCGALELLASSGAGPWLSRYRELLIKEFERVWAEDRQLFVVRSVTGRAYETSVKPGSEDGSMPAHRLEGASFVAASTTGLARSTREDPFSLHEANVAFYESFGEAHLALGRGAGGTTHDYCCSRLGGKDMLFVDQKETPSPPPLPLERIMEGFLPGKSDLVPYAAVGAKGLSPELPTGTKPRALGSRGATGFVSMVRLAPGLEFQQAAGFGDQILLGFEYESWPSGNRFLVEAGSGKASCPEASLPPEEMSLFLKCPDSEEMAQLMRIYVVTPSSPLVVCFQPRLIFPTKSPAFLWSTDLDDGIAVPPDSLVVFRLPLVYSTGTEPIERSQAEAGKLLPGAVAVKGGA